MSDAILAYVDMRGSTAVNGVSPCTATWAGRSFRGVRPRRMWKPAARASAPVACEESSSGRSPARSLRSHTRAGSGLQGKRGNNANSRSSGENRAIPPSSTF